MADNQKPISTKYQVKCYEKVVGDGDICHHGEQEYEFTEEELRRFIDKRLPLGECNNPLFDEAGSRTEQHLVTYSIHIQRANPKTNETGDEIIW